MAPHSSKCSPFPARIQGQAPDRAIGAFLQTPAAAGTLAWRALCLLAAAWFSLPPPAAHGQQRFSADEVKAAFLYNFAGFVTWPPEARAADSIVIGVMNAEEVEAELRRSAATRPGRPVSVRRVVSAEDAGGVHILFVGSRENSRLARILPAVRQAPVLTVTEAPDGLEHGSIINFVTADRVQFEISTDAAARSGLRLNARLLSVAMRVKKGERPGERAIAGTDPPVIPGRLLPPFRRAAGAIARPGPAARV